MTFYASDNAHQTSGRNDEKRLTFARRAPPLPPPGPPVFPCKDLLDAVDERGATPPPVPTPTAGDIDRAGIVGGGPGSAPGDRRCKERDGPPSVFIVFGAPSRVRSRRRATGHRPVSCSFSFVALSPVVCLRRYSGERRWQRQWAHKQSGRRVTTLSKSRRRPMILRGS